MWVRLSCALVVAATACFADTSDAPLPSNWLAAVGRLNIDDNAFCTATLIAPDLVLTAGHCLFDPQTRAPLELDQLEFLAGWSQGFADATRSIREVFVHPDYDPVAQDQDQSGRDIALLYLEDRIWHVPPVELYHNAQVEPGDVVGTATYSRSETEASHYDVSCEAMRWSKAHLVLYCPVEYGASGAPIFDLSAAGTRLFSVVSAKAMLRGEPVALGTGKNAILELLQAALKARDRAE